MPFYTGLRFAQIRPQGTDSLQHLCRDTAMCPGFLLKKRCGGFVKRTRLFRTIVESLPAQAVCVLTEIFKTV